MRGDGIGGAMSNGLVEEELETMTDTLCFLSTMASKRILSVTPAEAGVQNSSEIPDSRLRGKNIPKGTSATIQAQSFFREVYRTGSQRWYDLQGGLRP